MNFCLDKPMTIFSENDKKKSAMFMKSSAKNFAKIGEKLNLSNKMIFI